MEMLVRSRAWGGNFLCNVGPAGDGTMHPMFYEGCAELAEWMAHSRESVIGALPVPDPGRANVPVTRPDRAEVPTPPMEGASPTPQMEGGSPTPQENGGSLTWYLHLLPTHEDEAVVCRVPQPSSVRLLRTGEEIEYQYEEGQLRVALSLACRTGLNDVVAVTWSREPEL